MRRAISLTQNNLKQITKHMTKKITKFALISLTAIFVSSCSQFTYFNDSKSKVPSDPKFYVNSVNVKISEKRIFPLGIDSNKNDLDLMTDNEIKEFTKEEIVNYLKKENIYSDLPDGNNVFECNFDINFIKNYYMFTNFKYAGISMNGYSISVLKDDKLFAETRDASHYFINNRGLGWGGVFRILTFRLNKDDEKNMVGIFSRVVAGNMKDFGK